MKDFDEIADEQEWDERACLHICREFISRMGMAEELNSFATERAAEEQAEKDTKGSEQ